MGWLGVGSRGRSRGEVVVNQSKAIVGSQWGNWTVVEILPRRPNAGRLRHQVKVRCMCGNESDVLSNTLVSGYSSMCRSCSQRTAKPGERFDQLVVLGYSPEVDARGTSRPRVECLCNCGNRVKVRVADLRKNQTNNCGCSPRGSWTGVGKISTTFFYRVRRNATTRGLEFGVTIHDIWNLYVGQGGMCALSGLPIEFTKKVDGRSTASLDRKDPAKGYVLGNLQWVHRNVNQMKLDYTESEFIDICRRVSDHTADRVVDVSGPDVYVRRGRASS